MSAVNRKGIIIKGVGGFYDIRDENGNIVVGKACGRFRIEGVTPLPGDRVLFSIDRAKSALIENILPRKNELKRPRVANVDMVAIVISAEKPKPDLLLTDKQIIEAQTANIIPLLIINKCDAAQKDDIERIESEYKNVCQVLVVSAATGEGICLLREELKGCCTCFAGQSAVGKSSILNSLFKTLNLEVGGLAEKTARGRHTTRHSQLIEIDNICVVDTPGFSLLDSANIEPEQLWRQYGDMQKFANQCRFISCLHENEPGCAVKKAVEDNLISEQRYQRYLKILKELKLRRAKKYD